MADITYLKGKTAVVTGATGGIGEAIAEKFAALGMNLVLTGRREDVLTEKKKSLEKLGIRVAACAGNLCDESFPMQIIETAKEHFGGVDVLVNNAGMAQHASVEEVSTSFFDEIMTLNVKAPYFLCQQALPLLRNSQCASIINICSVVAHKGYPYQSAYAASKHALYGFSKSLANEVYEENIRVHVICPGGVFTPMVQLSRPDLTPEGMILPEDIADLAVFYLSMRQTNAVVDEIDVHRVNKAPFA